mmetsp:Transcript_18844/g.45017  ORF Transcript_18844/g.45017 Transcript_18844/m.45017 type:complete len:220 (-) Transcript_18844:1276-1935(-)
MKFNSSCFSMSSSKLNSGMLRFASVPSTSTKRSTLVPGAFSSCTRGSMYLANIRLMSTSCWLMLRTTLKSSSSRVSKALCTRRSRFPFSHITRALRWFWVRLTASAISSGASRRSSSFRRSSRMIGMASVYVNMLLYLSSMLMWYRSPIMTGRKGGSFIISTAFGMMPAWTIPSRHFVSNDRLWRSRSTDMRSMSFWIGTNRTSFSTAPHSAILSVFSR